MESDLRVLTRRGPRSKLCGNPWAEVMRAVLKVLPWQWEVGGDASAGAFEETCWGIKYGCLIELSVELLPFKGSGLLVLHPWVQKEKQWALYPLSVRIHRGWAPGHPGTPQSGGSPTSKILHQELRPWSSGCTPNTWRVTLAYIQWTDHEGRGEVPQTGGRQGAEAGRPKGTLESQQPESTSLSQDLIKLKKREHLKYSVSSLGL